MIHASVRPATQPGQPGGPGTAASPDAPAPTGPDGFRDVHGHDHKLIARHRERYAAVQALRAEGCLVREIARRLGLARGTAAKFASAASIDELLVKATRRPSILDPFKPYLGQRWNDGITSAAALHEEIRARGWTDGILTVERYLRQVRTSLDQACELYELPDEYLKKRPETYGVITPKFIGYGRQDVKATEKLSAYPEVLRVTG